MTHNQIKALHDEIHKAVIVEGKAKSWVSSVDSVNGEPRNVLIDVEQVQAGHANELMEILEKHGLIKAAHLGTEMMPKTSLSAYWRSNP